MPRYAAFLRGVKLGRNRRVTGAQLKSVSERLGFEEVATFRASGNVVFATDGAVTDHTCFRYARDGSISADVQRALATMA